MKKYLYSVVSLISLFMITGCSRSQKIITPDIATVYDYYGRYEGYKIDHSKPKSVQYFTPGGLHFALEHTPVGKIDKLIEENPEFEFLFYIVVEEPKDTAVVMRILDKYSCLFPVMIDFEGEFKRANFSRNEDYGSIGYICNGKNEIMGLGVIGTSMSFFDGEFRKVKNRIGL